MIEYYNAYMCAGRTIPITYYTGKCSMYLYEAIEEPYDVNMTSIWRQSVTDDNRCHGDVMDVKITIYLFIINTFTGHLNRVLDVYVP